MKKFKWILLLISGLFFISQPALSVELSGIKDSAITVEIEKKIKADPDLKNLNIEVRTRHRQVFLKGDVKSSEQMHRALSIARQTDGVLHVRDNLVLRIPR